MKIGIDPGLTGAIAIVDDDSIELYDMPIMECKWSNKRIVDGFKFMKILKDKIGPETNVNIELVHSMHKQGVTSSFTFGDAFGSVRAIVQAMGFKYRLVRPQAWKGKCGFIGMGKDAPRIAAIKMYPFLSKDLKLKKNQGRADALFIAVS